MELPRLVTTRRYTSLSLKEMEGKASAGSSGTEQYRQDGETCQQVSEAYGMVLDLLSGSSTIATLCLELQPHHRSVRCEVDEDCFAASTVRPA